MGCGLSSSKTVEKLYELEDLESVIEDIRTDFLTDEEYYSLGSSESLKRFLKILKRKKSFSEVFKEEVTSCTEIAKNLKISVAMKVKRMREIYTVRPLEDFFDFIIEEFQIQNLQKCFTGLSSGLEQKQFQQKYHLLGLFPELEKVIEISENICDILKGTRLVNYFPSPSFMNYKETPVQFLFSYVRSRYLEQFYNLCRNFKGNTFEYMSPILEFQADLIILIYMKVKFSVLNHGGKIYHVSSQTFPRIGKLGKNIKKILEISSYKEFIEFLKKLGDGCENYGDFLAEGTGEKKIHLYEILLNKKSLECSHMEKKIETVKIEEKEKNSNFHFGKVYSALHLKLFEIRNLYWISECVSNNMRERAREYMVIYKAEELEEIEED